MEFRRVTACLPEREAKYLPRCNTRRIIGAEYAIRIVETVPNEITIELGEKLERFELVVPVN